MRFTRILVSLGLMLAATGCHSPYVEATVSNRTATPITLIEVAYPSASFGTQNLAPGADFHYRFKVLGSGFLKLSYTDSSRKDHTSGGPGLNEGAEGPLAVVISSDGVRWQTSPMLKATPPSDAPAPAVQPSLPPLR
ncbi:hypothetical protein [Granulicella sp. dw_53]|uniref:hypothetical protein n=1 Tax=Granulicella sp. dw_53 TaxID=2719792 RepID=UPI001BD4AB25|nr:hypothetical protein [Granulicella sp. dw_53]